VHDSDTAIFHTYTDLIASALRATFESKAWDEENLANVARWYLRGRLLDHPFIAGYEYEDEYKDVLLHYITALENLVMLRDDREAITDKLCSRTAWFVGRNDSERADVYAFLKSAYSARSSIVHRNRRKSANASNQKKSNQRRGDVRRLSDICRRAIASALLIAAEIRKPDALDDLLRKILISRGAQDSAQNAARQVGSLTPCI
jgi:hypothetical protein